MEKMPEVAERVNFAAFKQLLIGKAVRLGGRLYLAADGGFQLITLDGGVVSVKGFTGEALSGFFDVVGKKSGDSVVEVEGVTGLSENIDVELWDEAFMTML